MKYFVIIIMILYLCISFSCQHESASYIADKSTDNIDLHLNDLHLQNLLTKYQWHLKSIEFNYFNQSHNVKVFNETLQDKHHIQYYRFSNNGNYNYIDSLCLKLTKEKECIYWSRTSIQGNWTLLKPSHLKIYNSTGQSYIKRKNLSNLWIYEINNHNLHLNDKVYLIESIDEEMFVFTTPQTFLDSEHETQLITDNNDTVKYYSSTFHFRK